VRGSDHDQSGQARALTLLIPIKPGSENDLVGTLDGLPSGEGSPLARVEGTHFARWVVMSQLVYEGPPQRRDTWRAPRLLFTSNFDGPLSAYLVGLRLGLGPDGDAVFDHCVHYPGSADAGAWELWVRTHKVPTALFFGAYGDQTVHEVRANVDLRARLIGFALEAQALAPAQLQTRFQEVFPL
jgi:hypothetical protein